MSNNSTQQTFRANVHLRQLAVIRGCEHRRVPSVYELSAPKVIACDVDLSKKVKLWRLRRRMDSIKTTLGMKRLLWLVEKLPCCSNSAAHREKT